MNFHNSQFGDLIFGNGIFGDTGNTPQTGIVWNNACPVLSAWSNEDIDDTVWVNQAAESDIWNKIRPDIKNSNPCRRD